MPTMTELRQKLDAISRQLAGARAQMKFKRGINDGHQLTSGELIARYEFLKDMLDNDIAEIDVHHRHVTALEQDALTWINSIDFAMS